MVSHRQRPEASPKKPIVGGGIRYYLYLVPTFGLLLVFGYYPPMSAIYHSFFNWDGVTFSQFIGLGNYERLFHSGLMGIATINVLKLMLWGLIAGILPALGVAELLLTIRSKRAQYWYRVLLVAPIVVPGIVGILLWEFLMGPNYGFFNTILAALRLPTFLFFASPRQALYSFMFMGFPWISAVNVLILLAGLMNVGRDLFDAAALDGASWFQRFRHIDVPLIVGQIKLLVILGLIGGFQGFIAQLVITQGGPAFSTEVPGLLMYQSAFSYQEMGYASAIGVVMFLVVLGLTVVNMKFVRSSVDYQP